MGDTYTQRNGKKGKYTPAMGAKGRATIAKNRAQKKAFDKDLSSKSKGSKARNDLAAFKRADRKLTKSGGSIAPF